MSATRPGGKLALAATLTGLVAAPLAVIATAAPAQSAVVQIQILGTNDFHGRLLSNTSNGAQEAGAAQFAGAVKQLEADFDGPTVFAAAGDLIGASTFESFIQRDKPTIDALNAAGLDVSAAGNHEFDGGYGDLVNRVMAAADDTTNAEGGANWQYLAANVRKKSDNSYALPDVTARTSDANDASNGGTWSTTVGGVKVGFVGAVTEDLPTLVSPAGIADVKVTSIVDEVKAGAAALKADGADVVVMLVHEGAAANTADPCAGTSDASAFGKIVTGVGSSVSAIISGHTHQKYTCLVGSVPVVSAGQYGTNLNRLRLTVDTDTNAVTFAPGDIDVVQANQVSVTDPDAVATKNAVQASVTAASAKAEVLGARELGKLGGPFNRAKLADGTTENRGGESTLGNLVAEVQRWATSTPEAGAAQIAFMNPGGLRQDMTGTNGALTYKQAAVVQPFANTLVNMKMTGAQIKNALEQQWQRRVDGTVPSVNFLRLGVSEGFFSTYDPTKPEGSRITGMWLNGKAVEPATTYSVTVNSFLAGGGDNFHAFKDASAKRDTGKSDLQAMVDYMAAKAATTPLPVNKAQRQVGVSWPAGAPRFYRLGQELKLNLSSLAMSTAADAKDATLAVKVGNAAVAATPVDNTIGTTANDESGRSAVTVELKGKVRKGKQLLTFTGPTTGTTFSLPVDIRKAKGEVKARVRPGRVVAGKTRARVKIKASALGITSVTGKVVVKVGGKKYTAKLKKGKAIVRLAKFSKAGKKRVVVKYAGSQKVRTKQTVVKLKVRRR
ncbi:5'-nucleotidase [Nocardioides cavernae]|uniref:5'-nucleotidase n=1 Tax=Nocardioides cavernae TaxID=1921566 RepID=A0A7Y9H7G2_9ACTN|nr:bifunctional UDP-sugar hydrolase/5'-nucleotidase [Nocardioides cavernae]NYE38709.1 5'-nucleotidase [Nocardioides cavernae]